MDTLLIKKIEALTLYVIQLKEENDKLKIEINENKGGGRNEIPKL